MRGDFVTSKAGTGQLLRKRMGQQMFMQLLLGSSYGEVEEATADRAL